MTEKFRNKFRIQSTRLQHWDYSWDGAYFVTICTKDRVGYFGNIRDGVMHLSHVGVIASVCWFEVKNHAKNIELGEFIAMPNHIHGIIILNRKTSDHHEPQEKSDPNYLEQSQNFKSSQPLLQVPISLNELKPPNQYNETIGHQRFQNQEKNSLSSIIGGYKSAVSKHANRLGFNFTWQNRFHDHIIRDDQSFQNISDYIIKNPSKWSEDKFFVP